jgi:beta-glucosidase
MKADIEKLNKARKKAKELLAKMNINEKVGQLSQFGRSIYGGVESYYEDHYKEGKIGSYLGVTGANKTNMVQKNLMSETPHNIPAIFAYDVIHGYKTTFPTPLTQSFSWDTNVVRECASVSAKEAYAAGVKWTFAPMVDIARDPRWGRIMEGYGEDPYLCSEMAKAAVEGYQGDFIGQKDKVIACAKHFVTYGACIGGRDYNSADMSLQTLHDVYIPPFKAAFDAGAATCMAAFNDFNGVPCTCNKYLLKDVLRKQLGFDGVVISDAGAVVELIPHNVCDNVKDAVDLAFNAGIDIIMAFDPFNDNIPELVEEGRINIEDVDKAVERVLVIKELLGLFDDPFVEEEGEQCFFSPEHRAVARDSARRSVVLLKNEEKVLPIEKGAKIALIGPLAENKADVLGSWAGLCEPEKTITVMEGIAGAYGWEKVFYAKGCDIDSSGKSGFDEALHIAKQADVVILAVGESRDMSGEACCRSDLRLPGVQEELISKIAETGKPICAIVFAGRPIVMESWKDSVKSILFAGQTGTETGNAVADIISGEYNPSGRLTCTFPYSVGQIPIYYSALNTGRPALGKIRFEAKYMDAPIEPAYCFGYGLSYTEFEYSNLKLSKKEINKDEFLDISVNVKNIGEFDGEEVVQLYVRDLIGTSARPMKELKGFKKVFVKKGETVKVEFRLHALSLAFHSFDMEYVIEPGEFKIMIGKSSQDIVLEDNFYVKEGII